MKKLIEELAFASKLQTAYSGSVRVMYVRGDEIAVTNFLMWVRRTYPDLAFQVKNGNHEEKFPEVAKKDNKIAPPEYKPVELPPVTIPGQHLLMDEIGQAEFVKEKKKPTFEEVDTYLLANPVDRKTKGPYDAAAAHFGVKTEYIRKRWSALREKGLVEKESETTNA